MRAALNIIIACLSWLPVEVRAAIGRGLGALYSLIPTRERRVAALQLDLIVPDLGGSRLVPAVFSSLGQTALEAINLAPLLSRSHAIECAQLSEILNWTSNSRGTVALTAHLSNWELLAAYFAHKGVKLTVIGRPARAQAAQQALATLRKQYGVETIWRTDGAGIRRIISTLKRGEVVAALIDQDTQVVNQSIDFFGMPAATPSGLLELGRRLGCNIVGCLITRNKLTRYNVAATYFDDKLSHPETLLAFNLFLEGQIRIHPEQWVWFHKRWRTHPTKGKMSSHEYLKFLQTQINQRNVRPGIVGV